MKPRLSVASDSLCDQLRGRKKEQWMLWSDAAAVLTESGLSTGVYIYFRISNIIVKKEVGVGKGWCKNSSGH